MSDRLIKADELSVGDDNVCAKVREAIAAGAPHDDEEMKRLAERATSHLDSAKAEAMRFRLQDVLLHLVLSREFRSDEMIAEAMRDLEAALSDIERMSKSTEDAPR